NTVWSSPGPPCRTSTGSPDPRSSTYNRVLFASMSMCGTMTCMSLTGKDLLGGPPPTLLPDEPEPRTQLEAGTDPASVAARFPTHSAAWAALADAAWSRGATIESYAYARVGYHRGLDALR